MNTLEFDYFYRHLNAGVSIDETCFYFSDDENEIEHYLGFLPNFEKPYWVGYCDILDGTEFYTAKELIDAKIYNGKSIRERWNQVRIVSIGGLNLEDWLECFQHV